MRPAVEAAFLEVETRRASLLQLHRKRRCVGWLVVRSGASWEQDRGAAAAAGEEENEGGSGGSVGQRGLAGARWDQMGGSEADWVRGTAREGSRPRCSRPRPWRRQAQRATCRSGSGSGRPTWPADKNPDQNPRSSGGGAGCLPRPIEAGEMEMASAKEQEKEQEQDKEEQDKEKEKEKQEECPAASTFPSPCGARRT